MSNCQQCGGFVNSDDVCPKDGARGMFTNLKPVSPTMLAPHSGAPSTPFGQRPSDANQIPRPDAAGGVPKQ